MEGGDNSSTLDMSTEIPVDRTDDFSIDKEPMPEFLLLDEELDPLDPAIEDVVSADTGLIVQPLVSSQGKKGLNVPSKDYICFASIVTSQLGACTQSRHGRFVS